MIEDFTHPNPEVRLEMEADASYRLDDYRGLDSGIAEAVFALWRGKVETFESCEGGIDHGFPEPTIRFEGDDAEGPRVLALLASAGFSVFNLRRVWLPTEMEKPWWEVVLATTVLPCWWTTGRLVGRRQTT